MFPDTLSRKDCEARVERGRKATDGKTKEGKTTLGAREREDVCLGVFVLKERVGPEKMWLLADRRRETIGRGRRGRARFGL